MLDSKHRTQMSLNIKLYFQISHATANHFKPFEVPNAHEVKIYEGQAIVLRNKRVEKTNQILEQRWNSEGLMVIA